MGRTPYSLSDFEMLLGDAARAKVVIDRGGGQLVQASWVCGCQAMGSDFTEMLLQTCHEHLPHAADEQAVPTLP